MAFLDIGDWSFDRGSSAREARALAMRFHFFVSTGNGAIYCAPQNMACLSHDALRDEKHCDLVGLTRLIATPKGERVAAAVIVDRAARVTGIDTMDAKVTAPQIDAAQEETTLFAILLALSFSHFMNDVMQSLVPSIYPILKSSYGLDFGQIGFIALAFQASSSILQPAVGLFTDRKPQPYSLAVGMSFTLVGLLLLSVASHFSMLLLAAGLVGAGSSVFHPEASRVARMASGGQHGLAQSFFQVGGNLGTAMGPLLAAFIVVPQGQRSIAWFSLIALVAMVVLSFIGRWYRARAAAARARPRKALATQTLSRGRVAGALTVLLLLIFSKYFYTASLSSFYTFYLIHKFGVSIQTAQIYLFLYLGAMALGTLVGGPLGDRIGRRYVIWVSILGVLPFSLALPYVGLTTTAILSVAIGLILSSAFSAIVVYGQELMPGKVGTVAGLFFGLAFGVAGVGAAILGQLADWVGIDTVYQVCAFLPAFGLVAYFLPRLGEGEKAAA